MRVGVDAHDGVGVGAGDLFDLDATGGRAHEQDPPSGSIEDGAQVDLADDVGGRRDEHRLRR